MSFDTATARAMLAHLSPDMAREEWVRVGMALKAELGDGPGFEVFDAWSRHGSGYREADTRSTWRSIKAGGKVKGGTLVRMAQAAGWKKTDEKPRKPSAAARAAQARERAEREAQEARETEARHRAAADEAAALWERGSPDAAGSPYLKRKGVGAHGVRMLPDGVLLVPMRDPAGALWNVQRVLPQRPHGDAPDKLYAKGGRKSGLFHLIGPEPRPGAWLLLAEGYATAASVHEATGHPLAVAFDAGNLRHVAEALRDAWPGARLAVAGDDDRATAQRTGRNPGREAAEAAAQAVQGPAVLPRFPEGASADASDWNDLHQLAGVAAVREQVEAALQAWESSSPAERVAHDVSLPERPAREPAPAEGSRTRRKRRPPEEEADGGDVPPESFRCDESGLWRHVPPGRDGDGGGWRRVCDPVHVEALARDHADNAASLVLRFRSMFGQDRRLILSLASLAGDGGAWRGLLAEAGFPVPHDVHRRRWLGEYLTGSRPERHARLTEKTGWHGRAFVLPHETLGGDEAEPVLFVGEKPDGGLAKRGELDAWRWLIGRHCIGQTRLLFAVSVALAGPCLAWAGGLDSAGFHLVGGSSSGKTTALRVAASVYGAPNYLQRWRATDNGLETLASAHSDLVLLLDELAQLESRAAGEASYLLGNGAGKVRAGRTGGNRPRLTWRLVFLSSGEVGLSDHMAEAGKRVRAGQELRFVDLPADAGQGFGAFDHRGEFDDADGLARHLSGATAKAYGTLGRAWLEHLTAHTDGLSAELRKRTARFEGQAVPELASGQVGRVARSFALVAAAGEMATAAGLTGWEPGQAEAAAVRMFNAWVEARPAGIGHAETEAMLRQVRGWFEAHGEARFTDLDRAEDNHRPVTMHRAGWRKRIETETGLVEVEAVEWWVLPETFRKEIASGFPDRSVLRLLAKRDHLKRERGNEYASRVRVPGLGKTQVYRIRSTLLDEGDT